MKVNMSANSISAHVAKMVSVNNFVTNTKLRQFINCAGENIGYDQC